MSSLDACVRCTTHTHARRLARAYLLPFPGGCVTPASSSCDADVSARSLARHWGCLVFVADNTVPGTSSKAITVEGLAITPDDEFLLSSSTGVGGLGRTILWDFANSIPIAQLGEDLDDV